MLAGELSWKTAANVWGIVTKMFDDASASKVKALRVRQGDNPAAGVKGPDLGAKKAKVYLYPSEFLALVSCQSVPLRRRHMYAVACYSYARGGELEALEGTDIDIEHEEIHFGKAVNRKTGKLGTPKSDEARTVPIEPNLFPLLEVLVEANPTGRILRMPPDEDRAELLRADLRKAGVTRTALFFDDRLHKPVTFHDLKATCCTWAAVRGDDAVKIMRRAAHRSFQTTLGYIREAENRRAGFGEVFPKLPASIICPPELSTCDAKCLKLQRPQRDLKAFSIAPISMILREFAQMGPTKTDRQQQLSARNDVQDPI